MPSSVDAMSLIDPALRPAAEKLQALTQGLSWTQEGLAKVRQDLAGLYAVDPVPEVPVEELRIPVGGGHPDVTIFVINGRAGVARPGILHSHGGGTIAGSASTSVPRLQAMARDEGWVIVTVDYRLSPETRYDGVIEDNYAGLRWMHANADRIGLDPNKIAVLGESAGGGNAARLAITARDRKEVPLAAQILVYPMLDDRTGSRVKVPDFIGAIAWTAQSNQFGWECFLGRAPGGDDVPVQAVPAREVDVSGLPPTFIGVGALDLFVFEDLEYARRLIAAGVPTTLFVAPGAYHAFDELVAESRIAKAFTAAKMAALRRAFESPDTGD